MLRLPRQQQRSAPLYCSRMKSVIVGTAGHIDHGKTALVKALTGIAADRLEEEKRRGITIDIGFAHLALPSPDGRILRLGFVDVPGHERFVRNMLAGVGGIDLVLLVIAADESIKPQTREHFDICRLLSVRRGITVLTKSDLVDRETLDVVRLEVEEFVRGSFLESAPLIPVSSLTGSGLDELKKALAEIASQASAKDSAALARLPIDRVFTMKDCARVHLHAYTSETIATVVLSGRQRVAPGESAFVQLRLDNPVQLLPRDRFILRQFSPVITIGGGVVLDAAPLPKFAKDDQQS